MFAQAKDNFSEIGRTDILGCRLSKKLRKDL
jgi:hypothetical protein